jgi:hypothetical protein
MSKISKDFQFNFPLTTKVVENLRIVTKHLGDLTIEGVAYCHTDVSILDTNRYDVDIDFIKYNGIDVKPVIEAIGDINEIGEAAMAHASYLFTQNKVA